MHGMLSAGILILAYAAVTVIACYAVVKAIRGGPHGG
jgi:hypothetical protein